MKADNSIIAWVAVLTDYSDSFKIPDGDLRLGRRQSCLLFDSVTVELGEVE